MTTGVPTWFAIALLATAALGLVGLISLIVWIIRDGNENARQKRQTLGFCYHCGYDLRASGSFCPECGKAQPIPRRV
jgi:hypothetical protein